MTVIDGYDTRPDGPNRQERAHRVGAPESLTEATEEIGMLQVHTCVSVHCGQCGDSLGDPGVDAHYPTEDAALDAAAGQGWLVGPGGQLWCSACGPVLACEAEGHECTEWCPVLIDECQELFIPPGRAAVTGEEQPVSREHRHCRRCCLHESRPGRWLIDALSGSSTTSVVRQRLLTADTDAEREVA
jgi:hypothetical protein